jgi:hypothetical protein
LEGYAFSAPGPITKDLKGFEYHFNVVRKQVLQILRSHSVFIGASIVDDLLFTAIRDSGVSAPVKSVLKIIHDNGMHKLGLCSIHCTPSASQEQDSLRVWERKDLI